tara:strand:- start:3517 stop:3645 length:129 start_codon:yes stop_codon:yes gene_type:complete
MLLWRYGMFYQCGDFFFLFFSFLQKELSLEQYSGFYLFFFSF